MAIEGSGLKWHPLFWTHHDQWQWYHWTTWGPTDWRYHYGHVHLFLMGYPFFSSNQDAFTGAQTYRFALRDIWGPRSTDLNQQQNYRVVGKPKWFFHVTEVWRRLYIQPWDYPDQDHLPEYQRRGLKYDASNKFNGPYREGRQVATPQDLAPYWAGYARTLPLEYFHDADKDQLKRDNVVMDLAKQLLTPYAEAAAQQVLAGGGSAQEAQAAYDAVYQDDFFLLNHPFSFENTSWANRQMAPFSDRLYLWPIIEYQQVVQLNWEILPGQAPDVADPDDATDDYGDSWEMTVSLPYLDRLTQQPNSPFGTPGQCLPAGAYRGVNPQGDPLVPEAARPHYNQVSYDPDEYQSPLQLPPDKAGLLIADNPLPDTVSGSAFHNPHGGLDGKWVKQCLGGVVQARCKLILEHRLGGRQVQWVDATQLIPTTPFSGADQLAPAAPATPE